MKLQTNDEMTKKRVCIDFFVVSELDVIFMRLRRMPKRMYGTPYRLGQKKNDHRNGDVDYETSSTSIHYAKLMKYFIF